MSLGLLNNIKEIGIFIVIAQCILHLVPGQSYSKYLKLLIGVMMIAKLAEPIISLVVGEERVIWQEQVDELTDILETQQKELTWENPDIEEIYDGIEEELKGRINAKPDTEYIVDEVELQGFSDSYQGQVQTGKEHLQIYVSPNSNHEINQEEIEKIQIDKITLKNEKEEKEVETKEKEEHEIKMQQLKQEYGEITGIDERRIEIIVTGQE